MTGTVAAPNSTPPVAAMAGHHDSAEIPASPSDFLLEFIIGFLAPLFMAGCSGDLGFARLATIETIDSYRAESQAELVMIAQIIGFGLAAMDNLRLSMDPDISLSMKLRLRGGANALNRAAQQNARALEKARRENPPLPSSAAVRATAADHSDPAAHDDEDTAAADVEASIAHAQEMVQAAYARMQAVESASIQPAEAMPTIQPSCRSAPQTTPDWVSAVIQAEINGKSATTQRRADLLRATSLSSIADDLPLPARHALLPAETSLKPR